MDEDSIKQGTGGRKKEIFGDTETSKYKGGEQK